MFVGIKQEIQEIKERLESKHRLVKYTYLFDLLSQETTIPSKVLFDLVQTYADEKYELAMEIGDCRMQMMQKHDQDSLTVLFFLADTGGSTDAFVRSVKK